MLEEILVLMRELSNRIGRWSRVPSVNSCHPGAGTPTSRRMGVQVRWRSPYTPCIKTLDGFSFVLDICVSVHCCLCSSISVGDRRPTNMAPRPYFHPWLAALILFPLLSEAQQGAKCNELNACSSGCCGSQGKLHLSYSFTVEAEQLKLPTN